MPDTTAVPTPKVEALDATVMQGAEAAMPFTHHGMSIMDMFMHADIVVKAVMLMLLFSSFWCWAIIFDKYIRFRVLKLKTTRFEQSFWSGELLEKLYERIKHTADHAMAKIFVAGMYEWERGKKREAAGTPEMDFRMRVGLKEHIFQAMHIERNRELGKLERHLSFLATVGSAAPFVGLFGTVWGIMNSFQSIAMTKNTTLAVVAPGIAEALLATAIGLFAAIPAVIFYNKFMSDLSQLTDRLDEFSDEFGAIMSRELEER